MFAIVDQANVKSGFGYAGWPIPFPPPPGSTRHLDVSRRMTPLADRALVEDQATLLKALQNGHCGVFMRAQDLFDEMYASIADRSTRRLLNRLAKVDVLVIDEMGYLSLRPVQTNVFFKLIGRAVSPARHFNYRVARSR